MKRYLCFLFSFTVLLLDCQEQTKIQLREFSKIVFLSNRDAQKQQFDIFMMKSDGSDQINLTPDLQCIRTQSQPVLSPDGKKILYLAFEKKNSLRIMNIDNRTVTDLTDIEFNIPQASFSPQGNRVIFVRKIKGHRQIFVINTDGSGEQNFSNPEYDEFDPTFSSDGSKIVFVSKRNGTYVISIINVDGTQRKDLIIQSGKIRFPTFSPNGDLVVFHAYQNKIPGIYLIKINGKGLKNLIKGKVVDARPIFTLDDSKIIFLCRQRGIKYSDVCIVDKNGKYFKNLTSELNYINMHPQITPDDKSIIFHSIKFNDCEIYKVDINGKNLVNLTNHPKWDQCPSL